MSILLTDTEVSILLHENTFLTDGDFARAIQLALIEKIRKEPVAFCAIDYRGAALLRWDTSSDAEKWSPLFALPSIYEGSAIPTAQELENER